MIDTKNLSTFVYIEKQSEDEKNEIQVYFLFGICTDEFFNRVYLGLQCIYSEFIFSSNLMPVQLKNGKNCIAFVTKPGFDKIAKGFLIKIPVEHRLLKDITEEQQDFF